jgi:hypothetical protein
MATKRRIPLNKIEGVVAGGTATIDLPTNVRYHAIVLQYDTATAGGATETNMKAQVKEIRASLDGVDQRKASATQLFTINRSKGVSPVEGDGTAPGFLPLFFSEPQRETMIEREATAWGMLGVGDFKIEVDIADGADTPVLKGYAIVDDVQEAPQGIVKWKRNTITVGATGELPYKFNTDRGDSFQSLMFFETASGDIGDMLLEWDGVKIHDLDEYQQASYVKLFADGFSHVDGMYHIPLDGNHPADALRSFKTLQNGNRVQVQELMATLTMDQASNVTAISELVGIPD